MNTRGIALYAALIAGSAALVANPLVVALVHPHPPALMLWYFAGIAAWLVAVTVAGAAYARGGRRPWFAVAVLGLVLLPVAMAGTELGLTYARLSGWIGGTAPSPIHEPDPLNGWRPRASATARDVSPGNFDVVYHTDASGRRMMPAVESGPTVHVFGDSFAFGQGVRDDETALALLAARHSERIVNHGVMGYGIDQMMGRMLSADIKPGDTVVFAPVADDFRRNLVHRAHLCLFRVAPPRQVRVVPRLRDGRLEAVPVEEACGVMEATLLNSNVLPLGIAFNRLRNRTVDPAAIGHAREVLAAAAAAARARGATFRLVILASGSECGARRLQLDLGDLGMPYDTLLPACPDDPAAAAAMRFPSDYHWTPAGHRWAADALERLLFRVGT
ncbi:MAG: hypothetical protein AB7K86_20495 [Rhodospirillales bacterium]